MSPPYTVVDTKTAKDQLANLYLKYRRLLATARADYKITKALAKYPQGGTPLPGTNRLTIPVHPLRATYEIVGDEVKILSYDDTSGP